MKTSWRTFSLRALPLLLLLPVSATAQNADELAKQTQNPVASLISVPIQGNWDFGLGERDAAGTLLNVQPVMPFGISKSANFEAEEAWTAPLLFSISKVTLLGKRPVNFLLAAGPTIASPEAGANWRFRLAAVFLFPR